MRDVQLAGKGIFYHTGASLVMGQLNDTSFIAENVLSIPVSCIYSVNVVSYYMHYLHVHFHNSVKAIHTYVYIVLIQYTLCIFKVSSL